MTAKVSDYKDILYVREYSHDAPPQEELAKRVALAALPFLGLVPALRFPLSIAMGTLRAWNADSALDGTVAVIGLAAGFFQHPLGMAITTAHDIFLEIKQIRTAENGEEVAKGILRISGNLLFLAMIVQGGLELSILSLAMQAALNCIQSYDEFKRERWIEGTANLLMASVRFYQCYGQCLQLKRKWEIQAALQSIYVGALREKWRLPSDHLPIGIEVDGVRVISWNVLNNAHIEWVTEKDSQGLNGSIISELNVPIQDNGLTLRDVLVADMVQEMMARGQIVALQECGEPFLQHLKGRLSADWDMVRSYSSERKDQDVLLYNKAQLSYRPAFSETSESAYPSFPKRPLQNACFSRKEGADFQIINAHIPGEPSKPGRQEFARYVKDQYREGSITIALGDNNFEREEMLDAYRKAGFSEFSLHSPWKTNIDPETKQSKGIDHFFVIGTDASRDLKPDEVLGGPDLQRTIDLLNGAC